MKEFKGMPAFKPPNPPGYLAYLAGEAEMQETIRSIQEFCRGLMNDKQKAKNLFIEMGVLQPHGRTI